MHASLALPALTKRQARLRRLTAGESECRCITREKPEINIQVEIGAVRRKDYANNGKGGIEGDN